MYVCAYDCVQLWYIIQLGFTLKVRKSNEDIRRITGVACTTDKVREARLRWYNGKKRMTVSSESLRQTFMDNGVEEDRERDGLTSSSTTWRTCGSRWRTQRIVLNGEAEPMWMTPHQRDSQP